MAQPITWRNVAAPDATAAIKGMAYANETLNSALTKAQGTVGTMVDRVATQHAEAKDTNTRAIMQALQGIDSMDKYKAAVASGDFNPDVLQQRFGKDIDLDAVGKAVLQRDNDIMTQETQDYEYKRLGEDRAAEGFIAQFDSDLLKTPINAETQAAFDERIKAWEGPDRLKTAMYARLEEQRAADKGEGQADEQYGWKKQEYADSRAEVARQAQLRADDQSIVAASQSAMERNLAVPKLRTAFTENFLGEAISANPVLGHLFKGVDKNGYPISAEEDTIPLDTLRNLGTENMEALSPKLKRDLQSAAVNGTLTTPGVSLEIGKKVAKELKETFLGRYGEQLKGNPQLTDQTPSEIAKDMLKGVKKPSSAQLQAATALAGTVSSALTAATTEMAPQQKMFYDSEVKKLQGAAESSLMAINQKFEADQNELTIRREAMAKNGGNEAAELGLKEVFTALDSTGESWFTTDKGGKQLRGEDAKQYIDNVVRQGFTYKDADGKKKTIPYNAYAVKTALTILGQDSEVGADDRYINPTAYESSLNRIMQEWVDTTETGKLSMDLKHQQANAIWDLNKGLQRSLNQLQNQ